MHKFKKYKITTKISPKIAYEGCVTVIYKQNENISINKVHNTGEIALFTALTRALASYDIKDYIPTKLMAYTNGEEALTQTISYASAPTPYLDNAQASGVRNNAVQYTFIIPVNNLSMRGDDIDEIALLNNKNERCAYIKLQGSQKIKTNVSSSILIYWKLEFSNKTETE